MGALNNLMFLVTLVSAVYIGLKIRDFYSDLPIPDFGEPYWGPGEPKEDNKEIKEFKIKFEKNVIEDLKLRLSQYRYVPPLEDSKHHYGLNSNLLNEIVIYWREKYNFAEREKYLNKYPHYKTQIQGLNIHFIRVKPKNVPSNVKVLPLMLLHGWPGSVREFYEIIPFLTTPKDGIVFEVIVPSLPGYGFSDGAAKQGLHAASAAVVLKNLMLRLGFKQFYLQGGDWGAITVSHMATLFPQHVLGVHSNLCFTDAPKTITKWILAGFWPSLFVEEKYHHRLYPVSEKLKLLMLESGYFHIAATKPDTIGAALSNSPAGLAAYIIEKFVAGTKFDYKDNDDGGLLTHYTYDALLDNVMIYWINNAMTTAMRFYAENYTMKFLSTKLSRVPVSVPYACAKYENEIAYFTDYMLQNKYTNIVYSKEYDFGGHFAALENPEHLAGEIFAAIKKMV